MLNKIVLAIEGEISRKYRVALVYWIINVHQESQLFMQRTEVLLEESREFQQGTNIWQTTNIKPKRCHFRKFQCTSAGILINLYRCTYLEQKDMSILFKFNT